MTFQFKRGDYLVVKNPLRIYKITGNHEFGYNGTYVGPGTQTVDNALISIRYSTAHNPEHARLATKAELVLYT